MVTYLCQRLIHHNGLLAGATREENPAKARKLLAVRAAEQMSKEPSTPAAAADAHAMPCPCCGGRMIVIEIFQVGCQPQQRPVPQTTVGIDSS